MYSIIQLFLIALIAVSFASCAKKIYKNNNLFSFGNQDFQWQSGVNNFYADTINKFITLPTTALVEPNIDTLTSRQLMYYLEKNNCIDSSILLLENNTQTKDSLLTMMAQYNKAVTDGKRSATAGGIFIASYFITLLVSIFWLVRAVVTLGVNTSGLGFVAILGILCTAIVLYGINLAHTSNINQKNASIILYNILNNYLSLPIDAKFYNLLKYYSLFNKQHIYRNYLNNIITNKQHDLLRWNKFATYKNLLTNVVAAPTNIFSYAFNQKYYFILYSLLMLSFWAMCILIGFLW